MALSLKGLWPFISLIIIPFIIIIYLLLATFKTTLNYKVLSGNDDKIGVIKVDSRFFNLKSSLLAKKWKFSATGNAMELSMKFITKNEGIITNNQSSYKFTVFQNKKDKSFFRGISKIEALNEQDQSFINIKFSENKARRKIPPGLLEISASKSINELLIVFFTTIIVYKYFIFVSKV